MKSQILQTNLHEVIGAIPYAKKNSNFLRFQDICKIITKYSLTIVSFQQLSACRKKKCNPEPKVLYLLTQSIKYDS